MIHSIQSVLAAKLHSTVFYCLISLLLAPQLHPAVPVFENDTDTISIPEGTAPGRTLYLVEAHDPDGTDLTYRVLSNAFVEAYQGSNKLVIKQALDYETQAIHTLTIQATDQQSEQAEMTLTINLSDEQEITSNPSDLGSNYPGQEGQNAETITSKRYAVYLIRFADADRSLYPGGSNPIFPTKETVRELLNGDAIQCYWKANSWGQYTPSMDVFGYFDHPKPISDYSSISQYADYLRDLGNFVITDPDYATSNYDCHVFLFMDHTQHGWSPGARAGEVEFTVNGVTLKEQGILHGTSRNVNGSIKLKDRVQYGILNPQGEWVDGESLYQFSVFQRVYLHEAAHSLGLSWHGNFSTNGDRPAWQLKNSGITDELNIEYADIFSVLGNSQFSANMIAANRDFVGWCNPSNRYSIKKPGKHTVRLQPINRTIGYRVIEVRVPRRPSEHSWSGFKNHGYFLEIREADQWSYLEHPSVIQNTQGILLYATDGGGSRLLDASPSPLVDVSWGKVHDSRDLALKPGMTYENHEVKFSNVIAHADGSFSVDVEVFANTGGEANAEATIEDFRQRYFGTNTNSGAAADLADPDHDGIPNRIEFALGSNPTSKTTLQSHAFSHNYDSDDRIIIRLNTPLIAQAVTPLDFEFSSDLKTWSKDDTLFELVQDVTAHNFDALEDYEKWERTRLRVYRSSEPVSADKPLFWRLKSDP